MASSNSLPAVRCLVCAGANRSVPQISTVALLLLTFGLRRDLLAPQPECKTCGTIRRAA